LLAIVIGVSAPGWLRLTSDDDIHLLVKRDPSLARDERVIRETTGFEGGSQFFLVQGADEESVLRRCEALVTALEPFIDDGRLQSVQSVSQFVPSARMQRENRRLLDEHVWADESKTFATLTHAGFRDDVAQSYLSEHRRAFDPLGVQTWRDAPISMPYRHLWLGREAQGHYAAIVLPIGPSASALTRMKTLATALPGTTFIDKAASVSSTFGAYRRYASLWLVAAFAVVVLSLALRYGVKSACAMTAPVALGVGVALALCGYAQTPLNLFNWLALMLVLCVGSNYPVFLREGLSRRSSVDAHGGAVWIGVLLSAATALLSFGTLALTSMPALRSFGMTLAPGIACSALFAPMGLNFIGTTGREPERNAV
jgi:predicted exporter